VTKEIDEDDDLLAELDEELDEIAKGDIEAPVGASEELGLEDADPLADEIDEAPEEVGLDVETLDGAAGGEEAFDDDEDEPSALDDSKLELDNDFDDEEEDEDGWTAESEGSAGSWDEDLLDDSEDEPADDGGLEGVEDPTLDDFVDEEPDGSFPIDGDDLNADEDLERVELDLG
jgi:hypothetical protein